MARARRVADSIDQALHTFSARRLVDIRDNKVIIVFFLIRRTSGWTAPTTALASQVAAELNKIGNAVLIGISNDFPSTSQIPRAYREAILALDIADVSQRVVQISDVGTQRLLLNLAGDEFLRVLPDSRNQFYQIDDKLDGP
jgi:peroxiredoxin